MTVLVCVLACVVALLALLVAGLLRSHAEILRALYDLGVEVDPDQQAPVANLGLTVPRPSGTTKVASDIAGVSPRGDALSVAINGVNHPTLLAFLTSGCSTCVGFWEAFSNPERAGVPGDARLVVVTKGEESESPARLSRFAPHDIAVVMSSEAWSAYDVPVAPYFVYVDGPTGRIVGEGAAGTWEHLSGMMEQAVADAGMSPRRSARGQRLDGRAREARADRELLAAGIPPGHPSLYPGVERVLNDEGT